MWPPRYWKSLPDARPCEWRACGAMMIFVMTFVITWVNVGFSDAFLRTWMKAYLIAYVVGVPVIFFLAPVARKLTAALVGAPQ